MTAKQHGRVMLGIPRRYSHFVFGVIQSGLTSLIAAGIASFPAGTAMVFLTHWIVSWLIAWVAMLPIVLLAAPAIRAFSLRLTREEGARKPAGRHEKTPLGESQAGQKVIGG
jgi:hypothetical protein